MDETNLLEGKTNFILVDRNRMIESSFEEIKAIEDLRTCLEVQFNGEVIFLVKNDTCMYFKIEKAIYLFVKYINSLKQFSLLCILIVPNLNQKN